MQMLQKNATINGWIIAPLLLLLIHLSPHFPYLLLYLLGYFGGITSFSASQFRQINGFPNNFWGWGGEDDELYKRTKKVEMEYILIH